MAQVEKKPKATTPKRDQANKQMYGIKNYLPAPPEGEDEGTISEHIKMLQSESRKTRQDKAMIDHLMSVTLAHRRNGIIQQPLDSTLHEEYVPLPIS